MNSHLIEPNSGPSKRFIIAMRCGRLANRLVLFANFIALAEEQGHRVINPTFHSYSDLFRATERDIYCQYPSPTRRSLLDVIPAVATGIRKTRIFYRVTRSASRLNEKWPVFGKSVVTLRESGKEVTPLTSPEVTARIREARTVFVYGWNFRTPELVRRHAQKIRDYFRPLEIHEQASRAAVARLRREADVVVGVHVRHGDYQSWHDGQYFFPTERYVAWMRELAEQFPGRKVAFFVCSNEARNPSEFPQLTVGFGPGYPIADLYALAECDYLLGPLSTFTQWASFYGNTPLCHLRGKDARVELSQFQVSDLGEVP
jgi:hypothetical protein